MRRILPVLIALALILSPLTVTPAPAQTASCQFVLGFQTLEQMIPDVVGACLDNVQYAADGNAYQHTTAWHGKGGLLVWRHADNWTAFTDGYRTWINGPFGLQNRLNTDRFPWEANPTSLPVVPPATPAEISRNWSGYAATGGGFTGVTGTWTVASLDPGSFGASASWVGIGGVNTTDLVQAGTEDISDGSGNVQHDAWVELLPQSSRTVPLAVSAGDSVTVSIAEQSPNRWSISIVNNTTGQNFGTVVTYVSSHSSAEWIEETPSARRGLIPLSQFGTVQFSGGSATQNGATVSIAGAGAQPIDMADFAGNVVASPSGLGTSGTAFSVSRVNP